MVALNKSGNSDEQKENQAASGCGFICIMADLQNMHFAPSGFLTLMSKTERRYCEP